MPQSILFNSEECLRKRNWLTFCHEKGRLENRIVRALSFAGGHKSGGKAASLMDKSHQKEFADQYGIPVAKTWKMTIEDREFAIPVDVVYPCIIKPEISALRNKSDIRICKDREALETALA